MKVVAKRRRPPGPVARLYFRLCCVLLLLMVVGAITFVVETDNRVEQAETYLQENGFPTRLSEICPAPVAPSLNRAVLYAEARAILDAPGHAVAYTCRGAYEELPASEQQAIARDHAQSPAIPELIREARTRPFCRYAIDREEFLFPRSQVADAYFLSSWLYDHAQMEARSGRGPEARATVQDMLDMADGARNDPLVLAQLLRFAIIRRALRTLRFCSESSATPEALEEWLTVTPEPESLNGSVALGMRGEVAVMMEMVRDPSTISGEDKSSWMVEKVIQFCSAGSIRKMVQLARVASIPYPDSERRAREITGPPTLCLPPASLDMVTLFMPAIGRCIRNEVSCKAAIAVTRQGLMHEIARLRTGRYPDTCSVIDPFSGEPLVFDPERGVIRSVGSQRLQKSGFEDEGLVWPLRSD